ncbi:hypothetical protein SNN83_004411 [Cronobacter malonaticus]|nr:hypothetical protein [Cronobacter malonaticus]
MKTDFNFEMGLCVSTIIVFLLAGCHYPENKKLSASVKIPEAQTVQNDSLARDKNSLSHLSQCNRDLESLRTVDAGQYRQYQSQYDSLMKTSAGFLSVKDDVSPEVAALARPRFQFALVNLCYRIKDALAQTLIRQAGGEK